MQSAREGTGKACELNSIEGESDDGEEAPPPAGLVVPGCFAGRNRSDSMLHNSFFSPHTVAPNVGGCMTIPRELSTAERASFDSGAIPEILPYQPQQEPESRQKRDRNASRAKYRIKVGKKGPNDIRCSQKGWAAVRQSRMRDSFARGNAAKRQKLAPTAKK
eukprot:gnl/Spiro4/25315_TR12610_c0_g1_i1.p2 gnl/Spiro4/25315_TR12610_c0_g1~~gnl/Spiro4/25315_TR12610_c0_g1_i1.p2  ORF type:complete len:162 (-),score=26.09 gnl/Spiro4/25315_TR12610_c0_g1_i1:59-544(-)